MRPVFADTSYYGALLYPVMTQRGLTEAMTADHHFEQAGFRALLR